jgi:hypothetical protein
MMSYSLLNIQAPDIRVLRKDREMQEAIDAEAAQERGREHKGRLVNLHTMGFSQFSHIFSSWELGNSLMYLHHGP